MPQKDTLDDVAYTVHLYARILSSSLTSVSIFSVCCYSIVSISMVGSITQSVRYITFRLQASYLSATSHLGRKSCRVKSLYMKRFFPQKDTLDDAAYPTSVSIFSDCCYSIVSISVGIIESWLIIKCCMCLTCSDRS